MRQYKREVYDTYKNKRWSGMAGKQMATRGRSSLTRSRLVEEHIELFHDIPTLQEMLTFVYDENNDLMRRKANTMTSFLRHDSRGDTRSAAQDCVD